ncbi:hypothetical protein BKG91_06110 [Rodentibacter caecimuris]|uniref:cag pathogenicity island Cag12 family protein n=3 Tax=Rodentibacter caecimuris TaxID=1796644 RepID=UPI000989818B|nr:cag pathogenicity island Cag12 family protein [Pasteurella caecimuris]OOF74507.1 hypothetical protein BKG91_06110 [Rodentibacter heylii]TGY46616.1 hypothetical protein E5343_12220 [Pasteurella caecimuris]
MVTKSVIIGIVSSVCFLSGCSSPPKPMAIDMSAPTDYFNNVYSQSQVSQVSLNRGDHNGKNWKQSYINLDREDYIAPQEKVRFFYFAHHADSIDVYGLPDRTSVYRYWLQANGVKGEIREHYLRLSPKVVNVVFTREQENEKK